MLTYKGLITLSLLVIKIQILLVVQILESLHLVMCIFSQRSDSMKKCEAVSHCCIHHERYICDILQVTVQTNRLHNFISRLGVVDNIAKSLKIYCDNSAPVLFSKNWNYFLKIDKYFKGSKHILLKYFVVKEIHKHRVSIEHASTDLMIVDPLTKELPPKVFTGHVEICTLRVLVNVEWCMLLLMPI